MGADSFDGQEHRAGHRVWVPFGGRTQARGSKVSGLCRQRPSEDSEIQAFWFPGLDVNRRRLPCRKGLVSVFCDGCFTDAEAVQREDPGFRAGQTWGWSSLCLMIL